MRFATDLHKRHADDEADPASLLLPGSQAMIPKGGTPSEKNPGGASRHAGTGGKGEGFGAGTAAMLSSDASPFRQETNGVGFGVDCEGSSRMRFGYCAFLWEVRFMSHYDS